MDELSIGDRIRCYQRKYGYSNEDLAMRLGLGVTTLSKYKNHPEFFRLGTARKLCEIFHVPMEKLFKE